MLAVVAFVAAVALVALVANAAFGTGPSVDSTTLPPVTESGASLPAVTDPNPSLDAVTDPNPSLDAVTTFVWMSGVLTCPLMIACELTEPAGARVTAYAPPPIATKSTR